MFLIRWQLEVLETCVFVTENKVWSNGDFNQISVDVSYKLFTLIIQY